MAKRPVGRPEVEFKWDVLDRLLQLGAFLIDCSEIMGICEDVIQKRIKRKFKCTFTEYRYKKMSTMRITLRQKQYDMATKEGNTTMLVWLGKQVLEQKEPGQTQKLEHSSPDGSMTPKENQVVVYLPDNGRGDGGSSNS